METNWYFMVLVVVPAWMVLGNCLVMVAVFRYKNLQNLLNTVIASLALTDFLLAVIVVPCGILQLIYGRWILGFYACLAWTGSDVILSTSSIMHLCAIAIHRFRGIAYPFHTRSATGKDVVLLLVSAWTVSVAISIPFIVQATRHRNSVLQPLNGDSKYVALQNKIVSSENISSPTFLQPSFYETSQVTAASPEKNHFLLDKDSKTFPIRSRNVRSPIIDDVIDEVIDDVIDDAIMHCGIFDHLFAIYSSLVSFFIPLAVMIFADIGSIRTLRRNASSKFKRPSKFQDEKSSKRKLFSDRLSADQISNENLSISTLTSPLTPTFKGQISIQGPSKQSLFFTESSNFSINIDNTRHPSINNNSNNNQFLASHRQKKNIANVKSCKVGTNFFWKSKTKKIDGNSNLKASTFARFSEADNHHHHHHHRCCAQQTGTSLKSSRTKLKMLESVSRSNKSDEWNVKKSKNLLDDQPAPVLLTKNFSSKEVRPRTRSLVKMERLWGRVSGRERRAEKTLIWVFLLFVLLWLPFFCSNLSYGICGLYRFAGVCMKGSNGSLELIHIQSSSSSSSSILPTLSLSSLSSSLTSALASLPLPSQDADHTTESSFCYIPPQLMTAFTWLGYLSSGVNPCIYTLLNKDFRRAFINTLTCRRPTLHRGASTVVDC